MAWVKLTLRLDNLPLVLCGPLVRRVDSTSSTVWIALRGPRKVTLRVYQTDANPIHRVQVQEGTRSTISLGQHLHVVAVKAVGNMDWGRLYVYDLRFGQAGNDAMPVPEDGIGLFDSNILAENANDARKLILYDASELGPGMVALDLPSFATPPTDLNQVRLIHGSCRKSHGESKDALQIPDILIRSSLSDPLRRPHQLFLTGDQIYADDVADGLLAMLTDAGDTLLGWAEELSTKDGIKKPAELLPGRRQILTEKSACFTSSEAKSHLLSLGEFYAMYIFAWSTIPWPIKPPEFADVYPQEWEENQVDANRGEEEKNRRHYKSLNNFKIEMSRLGEFKMALPKVRRALANIPSFMMFDDHEITDDWYLDRTWCLNSLGSSLGRRVIANGLLAYAVFQAWGNTPERFAAQGTTGEPGRELLDAASKWDGTETHSALNEIQKRVGLNQRQDVENNKKLIHPSGALDWHYHLPAVPGGPPYEVIVLDTRTWRGYPAGPEDPAALISDKTILDLQLAKGVASPSDGLTIVIVPAPVIGHEFVEKYIQKTLPRYSADREAWSHRPGTFELLLAGLVQRNPWIVLLSGDVHYGFSAHISYWAQRPFGTPPMSTRPYRAAIAQLTASSFKNETSEFKGTYFQHDHGWIPFKKSLPPPKNMAGWHDAPTVIKVYLTAGEKHRTETKLLDDPPFIDMDTFGNTSGGVEWTLKPQPDWRYRIDCLLAEPRMETPADIPRPSAWDTTSATKTYLDSEKEYRKYMEEYAPGREIVGRNNLGEITFIWKPGDDRSVIHQLWWWYYPIAKPLNKYVVSLRLNDPKYPEPPPLPELSP